MRPIRAGDRRLVWAQQETQGPETIALWSDSFSDGAPMPIQCADKKVGGRALSPHLAWGDLPAGTVEWILIMEDRDVPLPKPIMHVAVAGSEVERHALLEGELNRIDEGILVTGKLLGGHRGYVGLRPVPSHGPHHYVFQLFALGDFSGMREGFGRRGAVRAMRGKVIGRARLEGTYETP
jgi:phosphatidylethanolamine-binding protein (PEBP) family uncharacterized protein